jgi:hypothetical protein
MNEPASPNKCAIISKKMRNSDRLRHSFGLGKQLSCQFETENLVEYEDEWFCLAHLPINHIDKDNFIKAQEKNRCRDYSYVYFDKQFSIIINNYIFENAIEMKPDGSRITYSAINFTGASFNDGVVPALIIETKSNTSSDIFLNLMDKFSLNFRDALIQNHFSIHNWKYGGRPISISIYLNNCYFEDCFFNIKDINVDILSISNSFFNYIKLKPTLSVQECVIKHLVFQNNILNANLEFLNCTVENLKFKNGNFVYPPAVSKQRIKNIQTLELPKRENYKFKSLKKAAPNWHNKFFNVYADRTVFKQLIYRIQILLSTRRWKELDNAKKDFWATQFNNFRDLFILAKEFEQHQEQGDYYALMKQCYELNCENPWLLRFLSKWYGRLSDYGQSILRPLIGLSIAIATYTGIYHHFCDQSWEQSRLLSVQQTTKFFSAFFDTSDHLTNTIRWISLSQSLISLIFLAFLIFGLTWNFKKKQ